MKPLGQTFTARRPPYDYQGAPLIPRERFRRLKLLSWLYALAWAAAVFYVSVLATFSMVLRGLLWLLLLIGTPSLQDLFLSYAAYEKSWKRGNPPRPEPTEAGDP